MWTSTLVTHALGKNPQVSARWSRRRGWEGRGLDRPMSQLGASVLFTEDPTAGHRGRVCLRSVLIAPSRSVDADHAVLNLRVAPRASARTGERACSICSRATLLRTRHPLGASGREAATSKSETSWLERGSESLGQAVRRPLGGLVAVVVQPNGFDVAGELRVLEAGRGQRDRTLDLAVEQLLRRVRPSDMADGCVVARAERYYLCSKLGDESA